MTQKPQKNVRIRTKMGSVYVSREIAGYINRLTILLEKVRAPKRGSYDEMMRILRSCVRSMPDHFTGPGRDVLS